MSETQWISISEPQRAQLAPLMQAARDARSQDSEWTRDVNTLISWLNETGNPALGTAQADATNGATTPSLGDLMRRAMTELTIEACSPGDNTSGRPERAPLLAIMQRSRELFISEAHLTNASPQVRALDRLIARLESNGNLTRELGRLQAAMVEPRGGLSTEDLTQALRTSTQVEIERLCGWVQFTIPTIQSVAIETTSTPPVTLANNNLYRGQTVRVVITGTDLPTAADARIEILDASGAVVATMVPVAGSIEGTEDHTQLSFNLAIPAAATLAAYQVRVSPGNTYNEQQIDAREREQIDFIHPNAFTLIDLPASCGDGISNDGDPEIDAADTDCQVAEDGTVAGETLIANCSDGRDNDNDNLTDLVAGRPDTEDCTANALSIIPGEPEADPVPAWREEPYTYAFPEEEIFGAPHAPRYDAQLTLALGGPVSESGDAPASLATYVERRGFPAQGPAALYFDVTEHFGTPLNPYTYRSGDFELDLYSNMGFSVLGPVETDYASGQFNVGVGLGLRRAWGAPNAEGDRSSAGLFGELQYSAANFYRPHLRDYGGHRVTAVAGLSAEHLADDFSLRVALSYEHTSFNYDEEMNEGYSFDRMGPAHGGEVGDGDQAVNFDFSMWAYHGNPTDGNSGGFGVHVDWQRRETPFSGVYVPSTVVEETDGFSFSGYVAGVANNLFGQTSLYSQIGGGASFILDGPDQDPSGVGWFIRWSTAFSGHNWGTITYRGTVECNPHNTGYLGEPAGRFDACSTTHELAYRFAEDLPGHADAWELFLRLIHFNGSDEVMGGIRWNLWPNIRPNARRIAREDD